MASRRCVLASRWTGPELSPTPRWKLLILCGVSCYLHTISAHEVYLRLVLAAFLQSANYSFFWHKGPIKAFVLTIIGVLLSPSVPPHRTQDKMTESFFLATAERLISFTAARFPALVSAIFDNGG